MTMDVPECHDPACHDPECHDEVCVTCSDAAVEVTVLELLDDDLAVVRTEAGTEQDSVALVAAGVGDRILVHASEAIAVLGGAASGTGGGGPA